MTHLTLTGFDAGRPLCDCDKQREADNGAKFLHAMYVDFRAPYAADICPQCRAEWDAAEAEEDDE